MAKSGGRSPAPPTTTGPVSLLGAGVGGVEELQQNLDNNCVAWAVLSFKMGSGAFARTKLVAIHFNGEDVPTVKRGKLNARTAEVLGQFGEVHATIEVKRKDELTLEELFTRLQSLLTSDSLETGASSRAVKEQHEQMIAVQKAAAEKAMKDKKNAKPRIRTAKEMPGALVSVENALKAAGSASGAFNWVLLEAAKLGLENAGCGGLEEMKNWLAEDKVLFGVVRFTFAHGKSGEAGSHGVIVKHIFVHWVGPKVSVVKRGQWNAKTGQAEDKVREVCVTSLRREAHSPDDLDLEDIIKEFRRLATELSEQGGGGEITIEEYMKSLEKEQAALQAAEGSIPVSPRGDQKDGPPDLSTAIHKLRSSAEDAFNWVLAGVGEGKGSPPATAPAPAVLAPPAKSPDSVPKLDMPKSPAAASATPKTTAMPAGPKLPAEARSPSAASAAFSGKAGVVPAGPRPGPAAPKGAGPQLLGTPPAAGAGAAAGGQPPVSPRTRYLAAKSPSTAEPPAQGQAQQPQIQGQSQDQPQTKSPASPRANYLSAKAGASEPKGRAPAQPAGPKVAKSGFNSAPPAKTSAAATEGRIPAGPDPVPVSVVPPGPPTETLTQTQTQTQAQAQVTPPKTKGSSPPPTPTPAPSPTSTPPPPPTDTLVTPKAAGSPPKPKSPLPKGLAVPSQADAPAAQPPLSPRAKYLAAKAPPKPPPAKTGEPPGQGPGAGTPAKVGGVGLGMPGPAPKQAAAAQASSSAEAAATAAVEQLTDFTAAPGPTATAATTATTSPAAPGHTSDSHGKPPAAQVRAKSPGVGVLPAAPAGAKEDAPSHDRVEGPPTGSATTIPVAAPAPVSPPSSPSPALCASPTKASQPATPEQAGPPVGRSSSPAPASQEVTTALEVTIVGAKGLRNADWSPGSGKSDPYCVCSLNGKRQFRTEIVADNLNPTWNHTARVEDYKAGDSLTFNLWDKDYGFNDDHLGTATVDSTSIFPAGFEGEVPLDSAGQGVSASITLKIVPLDGSQAERSHPEATPATATMRRSKAAQVAQPERKAGAKPEKSSCGKSKHRGRMFACLAEADMARISGEVIADACAAIVGAPPAVCKDPRPVKPANAGVRGWLEEIEKDCLRLESLVQVVGAWQPLQLPAATLAQKALLMCKTPDPDKSVEREAAEGKPPREVGEMRGHEATTANFSLRGCPEAAAAPVPSEQPAQTDAEAAEGNLPRGVGETSGHEATTANFSLQGRPQAAEGNLPKEVGETTGQEAAEGNLPRGVGETSGHEAAEGNLPREVGETTGQEAATANFSLQGCPQAATAPVSSEQPAQTAPEVQQTATEPAAPPSTAGQGDKASSTTPSSRAATLQRGGLLLRQALKSGEAAQLIDQAQAVENARTVEKAAEPQDPQKVQETTPEPAVPSPTTGQSDEAPSSTPSKRAATLQRGGLLLRQALKSGEAAQLIDQAQAVEKAQAAEKAAEPQAPPEVQETTPEPAVPSPTTSQSDKASSSTTAKRAATLQRGGLLLRQALKSGEAAQLIDQAQAAEKAQAVEKAAEPEAPQEVQETAAPPSTMGQCDKAPSSTPAKRAATLQRGGLLLRQALKSGEAAQLIDQAQASEKAQAVQKPPEPQASQEVQETTPEPAVPPPTSGQSDKASSAAPAGRAATLQRGGLLLRRALKSGEAAQLIDQAQAAEKAAEPPAAQEDRQGPKLSKVAKTGGHEAASADFSIHTVRQPEDAQERGHPVEVGETSGQEAASTNFSMQPVQQAEGGQDGRPPGENAKVGGQEAASVNFSMQGVRQADGAQENEGGTSPATVAKTSGHEAGPSKEARKVNFAQDEAGASDAGRGNEEHQGSSSENPVMPQAEIPSADRHKVVRKVSFADEKTSEQLQEAETSLKNTFSDPEIRGVERPKVMPKPKPKAKQKQVFVGVGGINSLM